MNLHIAAVLGLMVCLAACDRTAPAAAPAATAAITITPQEAQILPTPELARRVLGAASAIVLDVERPTWGERPPSLGGTPASASRKWPPAEPPPLDQLIFFGRAFVTGSQFGLCGADVVTVDFDEAGAVSHVEAATRYGVEGRIDAAPGTWSYEEAGRICGGVKATRRYFPATDAGAAQQIALYVQAIKKAAASERPLGFRFSCELDGKAIAQCLDRRALTDIALADMSAARSVDCPRTSLRLPECYELTFREGEVGLNPQFLRIVGSNYMNRLTIEDVSLVFGITLE